jgi:hypothetical protein
MLVRRKLYSAGPALLVIAGIIACDGRDTAPLATGVDGAIGHASHADFGSNPEVAKWLAGLRQATVQFHDFNAAAPAGWAENVLGCMEEEGVGGMGRHYINFDVMGELEPQEFMPELLVYEPQKNGRLRLVAVEYAVPIAAWGPVAPVLHGIEYHRNDALGLWVLHAWIWKNNPDGMFANWNPNVTCDFNQPE